MTTPPLTTMVRLSELTSLTADDLVGLSKCNASQLAVLMRVYQDAGKVADSSTWQRIAEVLHESLEWVPLAALILQAIPLL